MQKSFSELVIEGPFLLVKGFILGFLHGSDNKAEYFFHRKHGIRRETFKEFIKELFEFENHVHVCLNNNIVSKFLNAIEQTKENIELEVKSVKAIKSANFSFSFEIFNEELAKETEALFENSPAGVTVIDYKPVEEVTDDAVGVEGYAPVHSFVASGSGKTEGTFCDIMELYLSIKRSKGSESIMCSEISLDLEETVKEL
jgi:hypothetical protein